MNLLKPGIYVFGPFQLHAAQGCIRRDGAIVRLTPKAIATLQVLIEHPGAVVSKETLLSRVWPETFVEEGVLAQNIATLRRALDLDKASSEDSYIETIPKRGYRFTAEVTLQAQSPSAKRTSLSTQDNLELTQTLSQPALQKPVASDERPHSAEISGSGLPPFERRKRVAVLPPPPSALPFRSTGVRLAILGALVAVLLAAGFHATERSSSRAQQKPAFLVVMPAGNFTPDPNDNYLSAGVAEQLVADLGEWSPDRLKIISYPNGLKGPLRPETAEEIRKQLGADYVLFSDLIVGDDVTQVKSRLVNSINNATLWSSQFHPRASEIRTMSREVAVAVTKNSGGDVRTIPEFRSLNEAHNEQAFREYLQGRYYFNMRSHDGLSQAVSHFRRAADLDPSYAAAYAGLADANNLLVFYGWSPYREGVIRAMSAAQTALQLDAHSPEGHVAMAYAQFFWKHDWEGASQNFQEAIRLDPESVQARHWYGLYLVATGDYPSARTQIDVARRLNPYSRSLLIGSAYVNFLGHDYDTAISECDQVTTLYGDVMPAYTVRGLALEQKGDLPAALADFEKALTLHAGNSPTNLAYLARVHALMGHRAESEKLIAQIRNHGKDDEYENPVGLAATYLALGNVATARHWLEKAIDEGDVDVVWLRADPRFSSLQNDPAFQQMVRSVFITGVVQDVKAR